jgi:hypothetical protein
MEERRGWKREGDGSEKEIEEKEMEEKETEEKETEGKETHSLPAHPAPEPFINTACPHILRLNRKHPGCERHSTPDEAKHRAPKAIASGRRKR